MNHITQRLRELLLSGVPLPDVVADMTDAREWLKELGKLPPKVMMTILTLASLASAASTLHNRETSVKRERLIALCAEIAEEYSKEEE
jgi:hypothetical protein